MPWHNLTVRRRQLETELRRHGAVRRPPSPCWAERLKAGLDDTSSNIARRSPGLAEVQSARLWQPAWWRVAATAPPPWPARWWWRRWPASRVFATGGIGGVPRRGGVPSRPTSRPTGTGAVRRWPWCALGAKSILDHQADAGGAGNARRAVVRYRRPSVAGPSSCATRPRAGAAGRSPEDGAVAARTMVAGPEKPVVVV